MNQKQTQRVILYTRVANASQFEHAQARQLAAMREFAAQRGWQVVAEFNDVGISGFELDRPGLNDLRRAVADGTADVVLVYDLTRLSRSLNQTLDLLDEFVVAGTGVVSVREPHLDFNRPVGRAIVYAMTTLNQYYQDQDQAPTAR